MIRQIVKYLLFTIYYAFLISLVIKITKLYNIHNLALSILSGVGTFIVLFLILLFFTAFLLRNDIQPVYLFPYLGKKIYHQSGVYYLIHGDPDYTIYKDYIFYRAELFSVRKDLDLDKIKREIKYTIDQKIANKVSSKSQKERAKKDFIKYQSQLKNWDGYLDKNFGRDSKIKKIV